MQQDTDKQKLASEEDTSPEGIQIKIEMMDNTSTVVESISNLQGALHDNFTGTPYQHGTGLIPGGLPTGAGAPPINGSNLTDPLPPMPQYYSLPYRIVGCLFVSIIFLTGMVGNMMVVIVVSRTRSMRTTTNCYLVSLAVADILVLLSATLPTISEYFLIIDQCVIGLVGCSIMVFTQYLGVNVSSLSIATFTVER